MQPQIIGISGSPIKNSNTDRLVNTILDATGLESEFVKFSRINVRPCFACKNGTGGAINSSRKRALYLLRRGG